MVSPSQGCLQDRKTCEPDHLYAHIHCHDIGVANIVHTAEKYGGTAEILMDEKSFTIEVQMLLEKKEEQHIA